MQGNPLATQAPRKEKQEQMNTRGTTVCTGGQL